MHSNHNTYIGIRTIKKKDIDFTGINDLSIWRKNSNYIIHWNKNNKKERIHWNMNYIFETRSGLVGRPGAGTEPGLRKNRKSQNSG